MAGQGEVGLDLDAARPGPAPRRRPWRAVGDRRRRDARGPQHGPDLVRRDSRRRVLGPRCPCRSTSVTIDPRCSSTPRLVSAAAAIGGQLRAERRERRVAAVEQHAPWPRSDRYGGTDCSASTWPAHGSARPARHRSGRRRPARTRATAGARSGSVADWAISNAPKIRRRISSASARVFIPGAKAANSSCPKYDCRTPAARIRSSYGNSMLAAGRPQRVDDAGLDVETGHLGEHARRRWRACAGSAAAASRSGPRTVLRWRTGTAGRWNRGWSARSTRVTCTGASGTRAPRTGRRSPRPRSPPDAGQMPPPWLIPPFRCPV